MDANVIHNLDNFTKIGQIDTGEIVVINSFAK